MSSTIEIKLEKSAIICMCTKEWVTHVYINNFLVRQWSFYLMIFLIEYKVSFATVFLNMGEEIALAIFVQGIHGTCDLHATSHMSSSPGGLIWYIKVSQILLLYRYKNSPFLLESTFQGVMKMSVQQSKRSSAWWLWLSYIHILNQRYKKSNIWLHNTYRRHHKAVERIASSKRKQPPILKSRKMQPHGCNQ